MIKPQVQIIGLGLGGETIAYEFQKRNYSTYLINGSAQDNKSLPSDSRNVFTLDGYDGLAGERDLALNALKDNKAIIKKLVDIDKDIIFVIATGGGTTGSGCIPHICNILCNNPDKIVCPVVALPRKNEPERKLRNSYETLKELLEIDELGATILINNESKNGDLNKINAEFVEALDSFLSDDSSSLGSNFDNSEKKRMLRDSGMLIISKFRRCGNIKLTSQQAISNISNSIYLPMTEDNLVGNIGILTQEDVEIDIQEITRAFGKPENVFIGNKAKENVICLSGLAFPSTYIANLGRKAIKEQQERLAKKQKLSLLDDLDFEEDIKVKRVKDKDPKKKSKISLDLLQNL